MQIDYLGIYNAPDFKLTYDFGNTNKDLKPDGDGYFDGIISVNSTIANHKL